MIHNVQNIRFNQSLVLLADQNNQISVRVCVLRQKETDLKEI